MAIDISPEFLMSITDMKDVQDIKKLIRLDKGMTTTQEDLIKRVEEKLTNAKK